MFNSIVTTLNDILWATPLPILCLGGGLLFTIVLRVPQLRHIKIMVKMLFGSKSSDTGLSSFQSFLPGYRRPCRNRQYRRRRYRDLLWRAGSAFLDVDGGHLWRSDILY